MGKIGRPKTSFSRGGGLSTGSSGRVGFAISEILGVTEAESADFLTPKGFALQTLYFRIFALESSLTLGGTKSYYKLI